MVLKRNGGDRKKLALENKEDVNSWQGGFYSVKDSSYRIAVSVNNEEITKNA
ncbi:MAG: hypothetical protein L6Q53_07555 [Candidatus Brocadia sinica]|nr:hypothetical protein [Candidatus Brocadia sinica]NUO05299.1 hypothetical protein [Candidatus Brocadia sinica]